MIYLSNTLNTLPKDILVQQGKMNFDYHGDYLPFNKIGLNQIIQLQIAQNGLYLSYPVNTRRLGLVSPTILYIPFDSIIYVQFIEQDDSTEHIKQKSVAKRAIVGNMIGGRRGARIGALSGLKDKKVIVDQFGFTYHIHFVIDGDISGMITLSRSNVSQRERQIIGNYNRLMMQPFAKEKYREGNDILPSISQPSNNDSLTQVKDSIENPYDELIKLKSLFDAQIITEEEFESKKQELLAKI